MEDYVRYPPFMRLEGEELRNWTERTANGEYALHSEEEEWSARQAFLRSRGYQLRSRYLPGWSPSWLGTNISPYYMEDSIMLMFSNVIDAVRVSDGTVVAIKRLRDPATMENEIAITRFLSSDERRDDPQNHCIPLLDLLVNPEEPELKFLVEPWVQDTEFPQMDSYGEVLDFIDQTLEGITFMHRNGVAHRDCTEANIGMDDRSLWDGPTHPLRYASSPDARLFLRPRKRAQAHVKYYLIDFGISTKFEPGDTHRLVTGLDGRDKEVPELSKRTPYDPFKVDIFTLGNLYKKRFVNKYRGMSRLEPLLTAMTRTNPAKRPSAAETLAAFRALTAVTSGVAARWPLQHNTASRVEIAALTIFAVFRELAFQLRQLIQQLC